MLPYHKKGHEILHLTFICYCKIPTHSVLMPQIVVSTHACIWKVPSLNLGLAFSYPG